MSEAQTQYDTTGLTGTEKQVEKAAFHREKILEELEVFKEYLMNKQDAKWYLDRKFFNVAVNTFCKERREHFKALKQSESQDIDQSTVETKEMTTPVTTVNESSSAYPSASSDGVTEQPVAQMPAVGNPETPRTQGMTR